MALCLLFTCTASPLVTDVQVTCHLCCQALEEYRLDDLGKYSSEHIPSWVFEAHYKILFGQPPYNLLHENHYQMKLWLLEQYHDKRTHPENSASDQQLHVRTSVACIYEMRLYDHYH
ncbi:hypothetical protein PIB30_000551 [Stylosanthes scabra]|uniref:Uncharacterized protein n=1 Tax=Stylosanthes scabra TaxID=79078 RepID=A0ABU6X125_9FABA|nr:hypothetical protein [Stylosanthes scabra]